MIENNTYKILIIEDDELVRSIYSDRLSQESIFTIDTAVDGADGLNKIQANKYDLIFSGIQMPNLTGFELFKKLQGNAEWITIPFVIFSHLGRQEDIEKAHNLGIQHFIVRGQSTPNEITQNIRDILIESKESKISHITRAHILIVEDDPIIRETYVGRFQAESNFIVDFAVDGADALAKTKQNVYDLIFSGIQMPNMTGFQLFEALKQDEKYKRIPIVLFSHLGRSEDIENAANLEVKYFIVRGQNTPNDIVSQIQDILEIKDKSYNLIISKDSPDYTKFIESFFGADCVEYKDIDTTAITIILQQTSKPYTFNIELNCKNPKL
jgi:CheY-like chemotaxis protein